MKKKAAGELVGTYAISGALEENTCGQGALPTQNPLEFNVSIRDDNGTGTWTLEKQAARSGTLQVNGEFRFESEFALAVGQQAQPRKILEPGDFLSGDPDLDLKKTNCTLVTKESMVGKLHRNLQSFDGGTGDAGMETADLTGKNTIEVQPAAGSDCSFQLASQGGTYLALPCSAHYTIEGTLQAEKK